jgi:outer membrane lipoprotein carrier protein
MDLRRHALKISLASAAVCLALARASCPEVRPEPPLDSYIREVESSYRGVKSWKANFVQVYRAGDRKRHETGTVVLARGGRMRWDYKSPEIKLFLADGKTTELYVPDEKQLVRTPEKNSEDYREPFALLLARANLRRVFGRIEDAGPAPGAGPAPRGRALRCFPKRADEGYDEVEVELTPALDVRRLVIRFSDRSVMEFTFDGIERNVSAPRSLFTFVPPAGTEVIDQPAGAEP